MIDLLIEAQEGSGFTDKEVEDEMITTVMGGHETTSSLLSFAIWLLAAHRRARDKMLDELRAVLTEKGPHAQIEDLEYEDFHRMDYATYVIKEALRLYPR